MTVFRKCRLICPVREGFYRHKLSSMEQNIYDAMFQSATNADAEAKVYFPETGVSLQRICDAFRADQPWFWYIDRISALTGSSGSVRFTYYGSKTYIEQKTEAMDREVGWIIDTYRRSVRMPDDGKAAEFVHDCLADRCTYEDTGWKAHCIYGVFLERKAVCQGIAYAYKVILNAMKTGCISCIGVIRNHTGGHAWNMVLLKGRHYYVDVTSDLKDKDGNISHKHALMSEKNLRSYCITSSDYSTGITGEADNWFMRNGLHICSTSSLKAACRKYRRKVLECELDYVPVHPDDYFEQIVRDTAGNISYRWAFDERSGYLFLDLTGA